MKTQHDPLRSKFRAWTPKEGKEVLDRILEDGYANCPVDGARLQNLTQSIIGGTIIKVLCYRCRQGWEETTKNANRKTPSPPKKKK